MNEHIADILGRKYRIALVIVAILVLGNQALVQPYLVLLTTDAPLINVAGRQRMLSQRLAKSALAFSLSSDEVAKTYLDEMRRVLDLWSSSHEQLRRGGVKTSKAVRNTEAVRDGLDGLKSYFVRMRDAARHLLQARSGDQPDAASVREEIAIILDNEAEYLQRMDRVVGLYESEARGRIETLRWISWIVAGATLAILVAVGLVVLRPAVELIRLQVTELRRARDELELRVRERTRDLEVAMERHRTLLEQFSHVGRTSAIGEMASGLAHELKQPLGAIANYAEGCLIALKSPEPALGEIQDALERLLAATMRSARIIEQVRRFVTCQAPTRESFEPNVVVKEVIEILGLEAERRGIAIAIELAPALPCIQGGPVQIQQVLVNLVRNSFDALAQSQATVPKVVIETHPVQGGGVEFVVSDNGEGIALDTLPHVFDAYFSTRAGGMGMGLAISRTIVEAHHGRLVVESDPGIVTTFRFILPVDPNEHARADGLHR